MAGTDAEGIVTAGHRAGRADPVVEEYVRLAAGYDRRWRAYVDASVAATLAALPREAMRVLDVGCGTGVLLDRIAGRDPRAQLTGLDPVRPMLTVAAGRLHDRATLVEGRAEQLPFADATFDAVTCSSVLHLLAHQDPALREMRRVLGQGGTLVITDWCGDDLSIRLLQWTLERRGRAHGRTRTRGELAALLQSAGFTVQDSRHYRAGWFWGLMTVRAARQLPR